MLLCYLQPVFKCVREVQYCGKSDRICHDGRMLGSEGINIFVLIIYIYIEVCMYLYIYIYI